MRQLIWLLSIMIWLSGIVIANGFWSTFFAIILPIWSYYLVVEKVLLTYIF